MPYEIINNGYVHIKSGVGIPVHCIERGWWDSFHHRYMLKTSLQSSQIVSEEEFHVLKVLLNIPFKDKNDKEYKCYYKKGGIE